MTTKWKICLLNNQQEQQAKELANELNINEILAQLLVQRGVSTFADAKSFFRPQLSKLHDPFLMKDMDKAVERLNQALAQREKILVYGDYDVDGTTAVALVYKFLKQFHSEIDYYLPDRYNEGYGISYTGIDYAAENGFSLVVALDCGIKAVEKIDYAREKGVEFIICDHHTPDSEIPRAVAVLDPKRSDCEYPYKHLCGCGVGFKLMQAFSHSNGIDEATHLMPLLDLVVVSIASDIVPITEENRILAYYGLRQLNTNPCMGLKAIIDITGLAGREILVSDIVFKIGPRINASGRMRLAREAVDLLVTSNFDFAKMRSEEIDEHNQNRKDIDKSITGEATVELNSDEDIKNKASIVIYNEEWHKGVIGIVASRLSEAYYKPTVVLTKSNGFASGSARSVPGFDIYKAIDSCRDLLENFGGHTYAAGLTMKEEHVDIFRERFETFVAEHITEEQTVPQIDIDAEIEFKDINQKFFRILQQFGPFGPDNMKPVFCTRRVFDSGTSRPVGKEREHLKLDLTDEMREYTMNGIAFRMSDFNSHLKTHNPIDICYTLEENNFNGNTSMQLMVKDIKEST